MVFVDEGALLTNIGIFNQMRIEPNSLCHLLHVLPNLSLRTPRDHNSIETLLPNSSLNEIHIVRKARQSHLFNMNHLSQFLCLIYKLWDGESFPQLIAAMAEKDP